MRRVIAVLATAAVVGAGIVPAVVDAGTAKTEQQQVSLDQVPSAVKATIEKEAKGGTVGKVTKDTDKKGRTFWEAEIQKNGKERFVHVSENGKVLKRLSAKAEAREESKAAKSSR